MSNKDLEVTLAIGTLILKYGLPAALEMIQTWQMDCPTLDDIEALKYMVRPPETYFKEG